MNKEEIFKIFYAKEKRDVWKNFQEIENSIENSNILYRYFDDIVKILFSDKAYIRMRGFRIICKLSKWDKDNKINVIINDLLKVMDVEKPTTVRQCLSALGNVLPYKKELIKEIESKVKSIDLSNYNDSMKPLIEKDINHILMIINNSF